MSNYVGREQKVTVDGKEYTLSRLTRGIWNEFIDWAKPLLPNVLTLVAEHVEKFPEALQREMASQAVQMANEPIERRVQELVDSPTGFAKMIHLLLQKHHPDVTEDLAFDISVELKAQAIELLVKAQGVMPGNWQGEAAEKPTGAA